MSRIHKPRRILAIGDIHGCSVAFDTLMRAVKLQPHDRVITLGDYVDRGPDSKGVIDRLIELHDRGQLVALRGNHEMMMLRARSLGWNAWYHWQASGGEETLASYCEPGDRRGINCIPEEHWHFLEKTCRDWWETRSHFFVHASVYPNLPLQQQPERMLFWQQFNNPAPHCSGKTMICGHTTQKNGRPINIGHAICIDTWVCGQGWLTCLDVASGRIWQANQQGEKQTAWIHEFEMPYSHLRFRFQVHRG